MPVDIQTISRQSSIDVLIPVYNGAATIRSALDSICQQTIRDVRVIVVDDGSTDETPFLLSELAEKDDRIHVITTKNGGIVDALNTGLAACTAEFVARFDADDIAFPERLQKQLTYLQENPDCVGVGCNAFHTDSQGSKMGYVTQFKETVAGDPFYVPASEPYLLHPFLMVRRQVLVDAGGYRYVFHSEDADLYWRLTYTGRLGNVTEVLGEYRIHAESISAKSVLNGRISAVNSQLAAISEQRRRNKQADLVFDRTALKQLQAAKTLRGMLDLSAKGLTLSEKSYLEVATAAKMLELASYRPYRLDADDFKTIRRAVETHYASMAVANRRNIVLRQMIRPNGFRPTKELLHLIPWRVMPTVLLDLAKHLIRQRSH